MNDTVTAASKIRLLSWNMGCGGPGTQATWADVATEDGIDVALLQEAPNPFGERAGGLPAEVIPSPGGGWGIPGANRARTAVARVSDRVTITPVATQPLGLDGRCEVGVSRPGTLTVANVRVTDTDETITVASVYAQWEGPASGGPGIYADASMHRILSDLSSLLSWPDNPVIVAGDFNSVYGCQDDNTYGGNWYRRNAGVFDRFEQLGLQLAGPQFTDGGGNGVKADPHPGELPTGSKNVPTFRYRDAATRQLDYCYVSPELQHRVEVRARNTPEDWGPSDHCRVVIEVLPPEVRTWSEQSLQSELATAHGAEVAAVNADLLRWAMDQNLRSELVPGTEGQWYAQLDLPDHNVQFTFSVRTRGDVVMQFQWMKDPFADPESRQELLARINEAVPDARIGQDRVVGRPSFGLRALVDPTARVAFLAILTDVVARTRVAHS